MLIFTIVLTISQMIIAYLIFNWEVKANTRQEHANNLLKLRLNSLKQETSLIQESITATRLLRHDLGHHYRLLYALLKDGDTAAALEHIKNQEEAIQSMNKG